MFLEVAQGRPSLRRSVELFRGFRLEQIRSDWVYRLLADDSVPFRTGTVDICHSSNVLEYVAEPEAMPAEILRRSDSGSEQ